MDETTWKYRLQEENQLAYRLGKGVRFDEKERSLYLIMDYPLKAIKLNLAWKIVMSALDTGEFVTFQNILPLVDHTNPERIEYFLSELVSKGFLEYKGYLHLQKYPSVSIIIPVRNRPEEISDCLESLGRLDYPEAKAEVIVVDDASEDNTPEVVSAFPVRLIQLKEHGRASLCRNLAAREAQGEILAFLDSDCTADPLWLRELIPAFTRQSNGAIGGLVDSFYNKRGLDRYEKVMNPLNMGSWPRSTRKGDPLFYVPSCNLLVRRELFLNLGGFKAGLYIGEDVDFCWRLQDQGHHLEYRPMGRVYHKHRNKIWHFCSRRFVYGTSEPMLKKLHPKRTKHMAFPPCPSLFWCFALLSLISGKTGMVALCGGVILIDFVVFLTKIHEKALSVRFKNIFKSMYLRYFAFCYHFSSFVSRYYLIWSILFLPVWPEVSLCILGMHLLAGITDYFIRKPDLNAVIYLYFFSLEQFSYQLGVWKGCLRTLKFNPVSPEIRMERDFN